MLYPRHLFAFTPVIHFKLTVFFQDICVSIAAVSKKLLRGKKREEGERECPLNNLMFSILRVFSNQFAFLLYFPFGQNPYAKSIRTTHSLSCQQSEKLAMFLLIYVSNGFSFCFQQTSCFTNRNKHLLRFWIHLKRVRNIHAFRGKIMEVKYICPISL